MLVWSTLTFIIAALALFTAPAPSVAAESSCPAMIDHKFANLMDEPVSLCQLGGKVLLIVNTASECGYTPQYDGLEKLYRRYRETGFVVLGFPSNDFGGQEPGGPSEINKTAHDDYGVSFPLAAKAEVKGAAAHPFFKWAALERPADPPRWNFHKYLIGRDGHVAAVFSTQIEPMDARVIAAIEKELH